MIPATPTGTLNALPAPAPRSRFQFILMRLRLLSLIMGVENLMPLLFILTMKVRRQQRLKELRSHIFFNVNAKEKEKNPRK
jgi:hypothetical protein